MNLKSDASPIGSPEIQLLADLFSSANLSRLAWFGGSEVLAHVQELLLAAGKTHRTSTVREVLDEAFSVLSTEYPVEYVYKAYVLKRVVLGRHSLRTTSFYTEVPIAGSRADILVINGEATVYEIKTPFDDLSRLESQLRDYYECFSRVILLTDADTARLAFDILPKHVGVAMLTRRRFLSTLREPDDYAGGLDHDQMFALLTKPEYMALAAEWDLPVSGVHPAHLYDFCRQAFGKLPPTAAQEVVVRALRERQASKKLAKLCAQLPDSLHLAAFSYRLPLRDWDAIICAQHSLVNASSR